MRLSSLIPTKPRYTPPAIAGPDVAKAIAGLIDKAKSSVVMVSGSLAKECYEQSGLMKAIEEALSRGVSFRVIVGPNLDRDSKLVEKLRDVICVASQWIEPHYVVVDNRHIRFEQSHPEGRKLPSLPNSIFRDVPGSASLLTAHFDELWEQCKPLSKAKGTGQACQDA